MFLKSVIRLSILGSQQFFVARVSGTTKFYTFRPHPPLSRTLEDSRIFRNIGQVIGLCIFHGVKVGINFAPHIFKMLLDSPLDLEDLHFVYPDYFQRFKAILERNDFADAKFTAHGSRPLAADGLNKSVNEKNKWEFVSASIRYLLKSSIAIQFYEFRAGLFDVIPRHLLETFTPHQLSSVFFMSYQRGPRSSNDAFTSQLNLLRASPALQRQGSKQINVRRHNLLGDTVEIISRNGKDTSFWHYRLSVRFEEEPAMDVGGPLKDFFNSISKHLASSDMNLFKSASDDTSLLLVNPHSADLIPDYLTYYRLFGKIMAWALIQDVPLAIPLAPVFFKLLLRSAEVDMDDLREVDITAYSSLQYTLECQESDIGALTLSFSVDEICPLTGALKTIDLIENGRNTPVTLNNREQFVHLMVVHKLNHGITPQIDAISEGLFSIIPIENFMSFTPKELHLIFCGQPTIDLNDWKANTVYKRPLHHLHPLVVRFWRAMEDLSQEQLGNVLEFATGSRRVPVDGFSHLSSKGRRTHFRITLLEQEDARYPRSHTCENTLDLPYYESDELMREGLEVIASGTITGFDMA